MTLTKKFLWAQPEPILDVRCYSIPILRVLVLSVSKVASSASPAAIGRRRQCVAGASSTIPARSSRTHREHAQSIPRFLPSATCAAFLNPISNDLAPGNEDWPDARVRWITDRNLLDPARRRHPLHHGPRLFRAPKDRQRHCSDEMTRADNRLKQHRSRQRSAYTTRAVAEAKRSLPVPVTALWSAETRGQVTRGSWRRAETGGMASIWAWLALSQPCGRKPRNVCRYRGHAALATAASIPWSFIPPGFPSIPLLPPCRSPSPKR